MMVFLYFTVTVRLKFENFKLKLQRENESSNRQREEMEAAHKANLARFQSKAKAEQKAQIQDLKRQMDNDMKEVFFISLATNLNKFTF